jgi:hypothetical protein
MGEHSWYSIEVFFKKISISWISTALIKRIFENMIIIFFKVFFLFKNISK